jgi:hypothetical protein
MKNLKELKNGFFALNGSTIPNDPSNTDFQKIKDWIKSGGEYEKFDYLKDAKDNKLAELNNYYNSDECWLFRLKSTKLNASLTKSADWFAKMLPACRNKNIQLFSDKNIANFFLSDKGADELNYQINVVASFKIKSLKLEAEKLINNAKSEEEIALIDVKKALGVVPREIEIDNI